MEDFKEQRAQGQLVVRTRGTSEGTLEVSAPGEVITFSVLREASTHVCLWGREWLKLLRLVIGKPVVTLGGPRGRDKHATGLADISKGGASC